MTARATAVLDLPTSSHQPGRGKQGILVAALPAAFLVITLIGFWWMGVSAASLAEGVGDSWRLLQRMFPPTFGDPVTLTGLIIETLLIAVAGTGLATLASIPLALAATRSDSGRNIGRAVARGTIVLTRAIPSLIFAILFVRAFGLGPFAGGLAIAVHSIGMIAKLVADSIDELDPTPSEAVTAVGARRLQVEVATVLPRIAPVLTGAVLYRLDINIRASAILGIVGAGGIGVALETALGSLNYRRAAGMILVVICIILVLELVSAGARRRLSMHHSDRAHRDLFSAAREPHDVGWDSVRIRRILLTAGMLVLFLYSLWALDADLGRLRDAAPRMTEILSGMWPPAFSIAVYQGVLESLLMAVSATTVGVVLGLGLAVAATQLLVPSIILSAAARAVAVLLRGIPDIVYAIIFVAALGLGPFPGFLALSISCTALAAKFFTDSLEVLDPAPREALQALGATRCQVFVCAVWPQFVPSLTGNSLFTTDLALRESTVLGVVGAGGIGFLMYESVSTLDYQTTSAILGSLVVVVTALEAIARSLRQRII
ncbi:phosphonate ABC transporter, permease protein PhnE [Rhodococcus wratislaviensis]|uniref:phosphonate ABC transporter, permease protein PhnE n=1 Tax=Rhodococcus wratislaviensis TaxID=44752 RepID=UPI00351381D9